MPVQFGSAGKVSDELGPPPPVSGDCSTAAAFVLSLLVLVFVFFFTSCLSREQEDYEKKRQEVFHWLTLLSPMRSSKIFTVRSSKTKSRGVENR